VGRVVIRRMGGCDGLGGPGLDGMYRVGGFRKMPTVCGSPRPRRGGAARRVAAAGGLAGAASSLIMMGAIGESDDERA
jgi:hypothetical protein